MTLTEFLTGVANAIRAKKGTSGAIPAQNFAAEIQSIQTGTDTSDATATAADILSGKTAYGASGKLAGTIATKTASNISVSGRTVTVPAGYYASQTSKSIATATQATPSISVSAGGLITASTTQSAGYVSSGTKSTTKQLTTQGAKTITPGTTSQTAVASGRYTTGNVTVAGDANLVPGNIRSGVSIFGVSGSVSTPESCNLTINNQSGNATVDLYKYNGAYVSTATSRTISDAKKYGIVVVYSDSSISATGTGSIYTIYKINTSSGSLYAFDLTGNATITIT